MPNTLAVALAPIFVVLFLGYGAGRLRRVGGEHVGALNTLVMEFALPAALFVGTVTAPRTLLVSQAPALVALGIAMLVPFAGWFALQRRLGRDHAESAIQALTLSLPNYAAAGLPIMAAVAGKTGDLFVALTIAAGALIPSPVALVLLELSKPEAEGSVARRVLTALARAFTKPMILAPVCGVALALAGVPMPAAVLASLELIGKATAGVALFLTGLVLSTQTFRFSRNVALAVLVGNILDPLLCLGIVLALRLPWEVGRMAVLMTALPCGFFGILFGIGYGRPSEEAGSMVLATTLASAVTLSVVLALLFPS